MNLGYHFDGRKKWNPYSCVVWRRGGLNLGVPEFSFERNEIVNELIKKERRKKERTGEGMSWEREKRGESRHGCLMRRAGRDKWFTPRLYSLPDAHEDSARLCFIHHACTCGPTPRDTDVGKSIGRYALHRETIQACASLASSTSMLLPRSGRPNRLTCKQCSQSFNNFQIEFPHSFFALGNFSRVSSGLQHLTCWCCWCCFPGTLSKTTCCISH